MGQLRLPRPRVLTDDQMAQIHEATQRILAEVGIRLRGPLVTEAAQRLGLRTHGERAFFERQMVEDFIAETCPPPGPPAPQPPREIRLGLNQYTHHLHDIETDAIVPFTEASLIEATKFADAMHPYLIPRCPGTPLDVAPELAPLVMYRIGALYCREGGRPPEILSVETARYVIEMSHALGRPMTNTEVYIFSPLTVGDEALRIALSAKDLLKSVAVSSMPSHGATTPIGLGDGLAVATAEVLGSAIIVREAVGVPATWGMRLCPFDPRAMSMTMGSPESYLIGLANEEVHAWYQKREPEPFAEFHTQAKLPGPQSMTEKMGGMLIAALQGVRIFGATGWMSLDEIFSPEQVVFDCEIRDHVQRIVDGLDGACDPEACVAEVAAGVAGDFFGLEKTVSQYRDFYWWPRLFYRGMLGEWEQAGQPDARAKAKAFVREQRAKYDFEPDPEVRRIAEETWARAQRELA